MVARTLTTIAKMSKQLNFCPNLSFMFQERSTYPERLVAAKNSGFNGVEAGFLYDESQVDIYEYAKVKQSCGLQQILINAYPGNVKAGDLGLMAIPGREQEFEDSVTKTFRVAELLECKKIHFLSGKVTPVEIQQNGRDLYHKTIEMNLKKLLPQLEEKGLIALIEPINNFTVPDYFLNDFDAAFSLIKSLNSPNVRLQLDFFHLQQIHGNLTRRIEKLLPFVGHIQIAQVPNRNEPGAPGEINYENILNKLVEMNYKEWIGLEYSPQGLTEPGLDWITKFGFKL